MSHWYRSGPERELGFNEAWDELANVFNNNDNQFNEGLNTTSCFFTTENGVFKVLNNGSTSKYEDFDDLEQKIIKRLEEHLKWSAVLEESKKNKKQKNFQLLEEDKCEHNDDREIRNKAYLPPDNNNDFNKIG